MNEEVVHMTSDDISPKNDLEDSDPTNSFTEQQNHEVVFVLIRQRGSTFELKNKNLLANIKVFIYGKILSTVLNHLKTLLASLMPLLVSLQELQTRNYVGSKKIILLWSDQKHQKKRKSKTNFKVLPNKRKKRPYSERVGTKADIIKEYYKDKIFLSQMMQIPNEKWKTMLVNNNEDGATEIIITKNKNDVDKSPRRFVTRPRSLESIF